MGKWSSDSKSHVAHMEGNDFFANEKSVILDKDTDVKIQHVSKSGEVTVLKKSTPLLKNEIVDASFMSCQALQRYFEKEISAAKEEGVLLSLHLKATMMKVSDPIMFGHAVKIFFKDVFAKHAVIFEKLGVNANNGLGDVYSKIKNLSDSEQKAIEADLTKAYESRPNLAMVDSDKGITNLHVPSDIIIDASMPAAIRASGKMWGPDGKLQDTKALIPDRSYAKVYSETIDFCKKNGAFDVTTMGNVSNVGLMAKKAEEYGSHDKTFELEADGLVQVVDESGKVLIEHAVEAGDIWRMCQTKDEAVKDWVKLAVSRSKATGQPAVFWLDENRAHDASLIGKVHTYLKDYDLGSAEIKILAPKEATKFTLERVKDGKDTISVTGNVLRDYLTDLFPILELGTSAKMLSIVPLLAGGGLYETGAGGSAPKHVSQFVEENHLRWDSLGEFLALSVSLEDLSERSENNKAKVLAACLDQANAKFLVENKSPSRKVKEIDNRGSHFYLALYWAQALAEQSQDLELKKTFADLAKLLSDNESKINEELIKVQGAGVDMGGYYMPDDQKTAKAMRPSRTLNDCLGSLL
jgi:isocitrate dehydrogenase